MVYKLVGLLAYPPMLLLNSYRIFCLTSKHHISWSSLIAGYRQDMTYCPVVWHKRHKSVHLSWAALDVRPCLGATKKSQLRPSLDKWNNLAAGHKFKTSAYYTDKMGRQVQEDIYTTFLWRIFNNKSMKKKMSRYRIASQRWFIAPQMIYSTLIICLCWALDFICTFFLFPCNYFFFSCSNRTKNE